ncbi:MAG: bifunctional folylpolyglutamate synthase/dihydrofolate synthase [Gemmatimonadales bacterium]
MDVLGRPERHYPAIHIGGTNGKGSTCAFLAAELGARGFRVGLYTSPHLVSVCERVQVDGVPISADAFSEWVTFLQPHIERMDASFFEVMTAIGFADLAARGVDIAIVEVGLGGRLDSTNVLTPLVSAVTKIALEHTDYLGNDLLGIAREKAGIAKPGVPFVTGEPNPEVREELAREAKRRGAPRIVAVESTRAPVPGVRLGLGGPHQWANAWVADGVLRELPAPFAAPATPRPAGATVPESFAGAHAPGRFERRGRWIFDVAHNPDGARVLKQALLAEPPPRPVHLLLGILGDKDYLEMIRELAVVADRLVFTVAPSAPAKRRWDLYALEQKLAITIKLEGPARPMEFFFEPDFARALELVAEGVGTAVVTGSFHTVGDALARLPGFAPVG